MINNTLKQVFFSLLLAVFLNVSAFAVTDQTPTAIALAGVADTTSAAAADGNTFTNTGYEFAEVINGSGGSITVTIDVYPSGGQGSPDGLTVTDPTVTVANGARKKIGPFRKRLYNNGTEKVKLTCSGTTSVTVGVYSLAPTP
jgi:hypothetical protein